MRASVGFFHRRQPIRKVRRADEPGSKRAACEPTLYLRQAIGAPERLVVDKKEGRAKYAAANGSVYLRLEAAASAPDSASTECTIWASEMFRPCTKKAQNNEWMNVTASCGSSR
jgi:hypothetical protein